MSGLRALRRESDSTPPLLTPSSQSSQAPAEAPPGTAATVHGASNFAHINRRDAPLGLRPGLRPALRITGRWDASPARQSRSVPFLRRGVQPPSFGGGGGGGGGGDGSGRKSVSFTGVPSLNLLRKSQKEHQTARAHALRAANSEGLALPRRTKEAAGSSSPGGGGGGGGGMRRGRRVGPAPPAEGGQEEEARRLPSARRERLKADAVRSSRPSNADSEDSVSFEEEADEDDSFSFSGMLGRMGRRRSGGGGGGGGGGSVLDGF